MKPITRARALSVSVVLAALLSACVDYSFSSIGIEDDTAPSFNLFGGDAVHSPYATGAVFRVWPTGEDAVEDRWRITSSNPDVLRIDAVAGARPGEAQATALSAGRTELRIVDDDRDTVHRVNVEVRDPDAVTVRVAGNVVRDGRLVAFEGSSLPLRGDATANGVPLAGSPRFELEPAALLTSDALGVAQLGPIPAGETEITVRVGTFEQVVNVTGVGESQIASVEIARLFSGGADAQLEEGATDLLHATATDAEGRAIEGVPFTWTIGDEPIADQTGSQLWYTFSPAAAERPATARVGGREASTPIRMAAGATPVVRDPIALGCSAAGGATQGVWIGLVVLGLLAVRRRRCV